MIIQNLEFTRAIADDVANDGEIVGVELSGEVLDILRLGTNDDVIHYAFTNDKSLVIMSDGCMPIQVPPTLREEVMSCDEPLQVSLTQIKISGLLTYVVSNWVRLMALKGDKCCFLEFLEDKIKKDPKMAFPTTDDLYLQWIVDFTGLTEGEVQLSNTSGAVEEMLVVPGRIMTAQVEDEFKKSVNAQNDLVAMEMLFVEQQRQERSFLSYVVKHEQDQVTQGLGNVDAFELIKKFVRAFTIPERRALLALNARYKLLEMCLYGNEQFDQVILDPNVAKADPVNILDKVVRDPVNTKLQAAHDNKQAVLALDAHMLDNQPTTYVLMAEVAEDMPASHRFLFKSGGKNMLREGLTQEKIYESVMEMRIRPDEREHVTRNPWLHSVVESKVFDYALANMTKLKETPGHTHENRFQFSTVESMKDPELRGLAEKLCVVKSPLGSIIGESQPPVAHLCAQLTTREFAVLMSELHKKIWSLKLAVYNQRFYTSYVSQCDKVMAMYHKDRWGMVTGRYNAANLEKLALAYKNHVRSFNVGVFNDSSKYFEALHHCALVPNTKTFLQMFLETMCCGWSVLSKSALGYVMTLAKAAGSNRYTRPLYHEGDDATITDKNLKVHLTTAYVKKLLYVDFEPLTETMEAGGKTEADRYEIKRHGRLKHFVEHPTGQHNHVLASLKAAGEMKADVWVGLIDPLSLAVLVASNFEVRMIFPPIPPFRTLIPTVIDLTTGHSFMPDSKVSVGHVACMLSHMAASVVYSGHEYVSLFYTLRLEFMAQYARWELFNPLCAKYLLVLKQHLKNSAVKYRFDFSTISALKRSEANKGPQLQYTFQAAHTEITKMVGASQLGDLSLGNDGFDFEEFLLRNAGLYKPQL